MSPELNSSLIEWFDYNLKLRRNEAESLISKLEKSYYLAIQVHILFYYFCKKKYLFF